MCPSQTRWRRSSPRSIGTVTPDRLRSRHTRPSSYGPDWETAQPGGWPGPWSSPSPHCTSRFTTRSHRGRSFERSPSTFSPRPCSASQARTSCPLTRRRSIAISPKTSLRGTSPCRRSPKYCGACSVSGCHSSSMPPSAAGQTASASSRPWRHRFPERWMRGSAQQPMRSSTSAGASTWLSRFAFGARSNRWWRQSPWMSKRPHGCCGSRSSDGTSVAPSEYLREARSNGEHWMASCTCALGWSAANGCCDTRRALGRFTSG